MALFTDTRNVIATVAGIAAVSIVSPIAYYRTQDIGSAYRMQMESAQSELSTTRASLQAERVTADQLRQELADLNNRQTALARELEDALIAAGQKEAADKLASEQAARVAAAKAQATAEAQLAEQTRAAAAQKAAADAAAAKAAADARAAAEAKAAAQAAAQAEAEAQAQAAAQQNASQPSRRTQAS